jgi:hypothetical protein
VFYRTALTRWSFIITGLGVAFTLSPFAPAAWHDTPSLRWLHHLLPFPLMACGFVLYVALLATDRLDLVIVADFLGLFMYLCELIALVVTASHNRFNGITTAAMCLACVYHYAAGRLALYHREWPL